MNSGIEHKEICHYTVEDNTKNNNELCCGHISGNINNINVGQSRSYV